MILDKENLFSNDQAITATAVSESVIDNGADGTRVPTPNEKGQAEILIQVTETFLTCTSVKVDIQTDSAEAFGTVETLASSAAIAVASLVAGYQFKVAVPAEVLKRYARLNYTVAGSNATAGKITAGFVDARQTNK